MPLYANNVKIKTRICDGQFVMPVVEEHEDGHTGPPPPLPEHPSRPGLVQPFNVRVTTFSMRMPELPHDAACQELWVSKDRYGTYKLVHDNLISYQRVDLDLGAIRDKVELPTVGPLDDLWWKVRAVNGAGYTDGEAIRDTWTVSRPFGEGLIAGYQGYLFADQANASSLYEDYYIINETAFGGSFSARVGGDIVMKAYRCRIPQGAYLEVISDYWVGQVSNNRAYYSISYKPDLQPGASSIVDHPTGTVWSFVSKDKTVRCGRSTRFETYGSNVDAGNFGKLEVSRWVQGFRHGATLVGFYGDDRSVYAARSVDEGRTWTSATELAAEVPVIDGIKALAGVRSKNGYFLIYGVASIASISSDTPAQLGYEPGDVVCAVLKESQQGLVLSGVTKIKAGADTELPVADVIGLHESAQGLLLVALEGEDTAIYRSTDQLSTLTRVKKPAAKES
jgi:hypothetical protein